MVQRVFPDANVLFSRTQRDWIFLLQGDQNSQLYSMHWAEDVSAEVISNLRKKNPLASGAKMTAFRRKLENSMWGGRVDSYTVTPLSYLVDEYDWHVVAAAEKCGAHSLVTSDRGFLALDESVTDELPFDIYTPDEFFMLVHESAPQLTASVAGRQYKYWSEREKRIIEPDFLSESLRVAGCPLFAQVVQDMTHTLLIQQST